jgi:cytochrome oxidase assembly protein ShyY1
VTRAGWRGGLLIPGTVAIAALAILLGLGTWQLERKAWKEGLIAALEKRLDDAPVALPPRSEWAGMTQDNSEFVRVKVRVTFYSVRDAMVYTPNSTMRDDVKSPGYLVFVPVRLPDGSLIVINRGLVPDRTYPQGEGTQEIVGAIRWPDPSSRWIADHDDSDASIWYVKNPKLMAEVKRWGDVPPFYIEQESPLPPGGLPHPAPLKAKLRNEHLQYAITWYGLAAVLVVMFALWASRQHLRTEP